MSKKYKIFAINPGSTSTKIALFVNDEKIFSSNVSHDAEKLKEFAEISDQFDYRKETILAELSKENITIDDCDAFSGRAGGLVGLEGGTYPVNDILHEHARVGFTVKHPATLGPQLAKHFAEQYNAKAFVVNPPDVDEFEEIARVCGWAEASRESRIHALNQKEIGIRYAHELGKKYEDVNLVIAHIGGGVSITAHRKGKMIDSNDIINGDGPMAPTRAGSVPSNYMIKACYSGKYTEKEMSNRMSKNGGLVDHLGTSDVLEIVDMIEKGNEYAKLVLDAMFYQCVKQIGSMAAVLKGDVDGIVLTGGIAYSKHYMEYITDMVKFIAPVKVMAGEFEMEALAAGALRVLTGEEAPKDYTGVPTWNGFKK